MVGGTVNDRDIRRLLGLSKTEWSDLSAEKREKIRSLASTPVGWVVGQAVDQARKFFLEQVAR